MSKSGSKRASLQRTRLLQALTSLVEWFERQKRVLPWREDPSVYRVWVSEMMLQQTQVVTVVPYFERFLARFPNVLELSRASEDEVLGLWAGLGYYSRARNLHRAARQIVSQGEFPKDREGWLAIPGVGDYTAGAILSIAYGLPEAILDGNVERVLSRVRAVQRRAGDSVYKKRLWRISRWVVQSAHGSLHLSPSSVNQALMELGATLCSPKKPQCPLCPLSQICKAYEAGESEAYPPKKRPKEWVHVREEVHCVFDLEGRILLGKRGLGQWRSGLWDFPEDLPRGLSLESVGSVEVKLTVTRHKIIRIAHIWRVRASQPPRFCAAEKFMDPRDPTERRWAEIEDVGVAVGSSMRKTLRAVLEF